MKIDLCVAACVATAVLGSHAQGASQPPADGSSAAHRSVPSVAAVERVRASEIAFARSMADRDLKAFTRFVSRDAVFANGPTALHGREAIVAGWKGYFDGPAAPFSWSPEQVEVVADGTLALSTGPVLNPKGERIGTYKSTWRRERDGQWRVVIDSGCNCNCAATPAGSGAPSGAAASGARGV